MEQSFRALTADLSVGGVRVNIDRSFTALPGEQVKLVFPVLDGDATLPATVVSADGRSLRAQFEPLTLQEEESLTMVLYSRADTWLGWGEAREIDKPMKSLGRIFRISMHGLSITLKVLMTSKKKKTAPKGRLAATAVAPLILLCLLLGGLTRNASGAQAVATPPTVTPAKAAGGSAADLVTNINATTPTSVDGGVECASGHAG